MSRKGLRANEVAADYVAHNTLRIVNIYVIRNDRPNFHVCTMIRCVRNDPTVYRVQVAWGGQADEVLESPDGWIHFKMLNSDNCALEEEWIM